MPSFSNDVNRRSRFGYIVVRFLVDKDGTVLVVDVIDSYPAGVYDRETLRTIRHCKFEPTGQQHLLRTQLNFWVPGSLRPKEAQQLLMRDQIWDYAAMGVSSYQEYIGSALHLIHIVSGKQVYIDDSITEPVSVPDFTELLGTSRLRFSKRKFLGNSLVQVGENGVIEKVLAEHALEAPDAAELLGMRIREADAGQYSISRPSRRDPILVQRLYPLPGQHTASFWWNEAAKNGNRRAQRIDWQFTCCNKMIPHLWLGTAYV